MIEVKRVEFFDDRWYKITLTNREIHWIPSVTTKLNVVAKPWLAKWRGDISNREADMRMFEAAQRGTRIHAGFDIMQKGGAVIYNPWQYPTYTEEELVQIKKENPSWAIVQYQDEMWDLIKLSRFIEVVKPKIISTELMVYSLEDQDAGTVDVIYEIEEGNYLVNGSKPLFIPGGVYIADLKTGAQIDNNAYRQTAAYLNCVKKMKMTNPIGTMILHTGSKNRSGIEGLGVSIRTGKELAEDYRQYRLISDLWMAEHGEDTPRIFEFPSILKINEKNITVKG